MFKAFLVLGLALTGLFGVEASAGVAVTPAVTVQCNTTDAIMGPINIYFTNQRGSSITNIRVLNSYTLETLRDYQGSGPLTNRGTGRVGFITVQGLPAWYVLFNDAYGQLFAQFTLNGVPGTTFGCVLN